MLRTFGRLMNAALPAVMAFPPFKSDDVHLDDVHLACSASTIIIWNALEVFLYGWHPQLKQWCSAWTPLRVRGDHSEIRCCFVGPDVAALLFDDGCAHIWRSYAQHGDGHHWEAIPGGVYRQMLFSQSGTIGLLLDSNDVILLNVTTLSTHVLSLGIKQPCSISISSNATMASQGLSGLHALITDADGNVHAFGRGLFGQLGTGSEKDVPWTSWHALVHTIQPFRVYQSSCGSFHSALLLSSQLPTHQGADDDKERASDFQMYTMGWNRDGQLGRAVSEEDLHSVPGMVLFQDDQGRELAGDDEPDVFKVCCGSRHTVVVDTKGRVWAAGFNAFGQCGEHADDFTASFRRLHIPENVVDIACGAMCTICIVKE